MTNSVATYLARSLFTLAFLFSFTAHTKTDTTLWGIDAQRGYKVMTPDEAISYCLEHERINQVSWKVFRTNTEAFEVINKAVLPKLYAKYRAEGDVQLGALSLKEMFTRFQQVRICQNYHSHIPMLADSERQTDLYLPEQRFVILNNGFAVSPYETKMTILLHVFLGASGYEDNNYELSHALRMAEKSMSPFILPLFPKSKEQLYWKPIEKPLPKKYFGNGHPIYIAGKRGGYTGGGGGGDTASALIKKAMYDLAPEIPAYVKKRNLACQQAWSHSATYIYDIKTLAIESIDMIDNYRRNPNGGYYIRLATYNYDSTGDITAKTKLPMILGIIEDFCQTKYGAK